MSLFVRLACLGTLLLFVTQPVRAELIANGDFEAVSGDPLRFTGWTYSGSGALLEQASAISGQYSAELVAGNHYIGQDFKPLSYFNLGMDFAVFPVGNNRTMHLQLYNGSTITVQMRVGDGNKLQAYDGSAWLDVPGLSAVKTTTDTGAQNVWDGEEPDVNSLRIVGYLDTPTPHYNVTLNDEMVSGVTIIRSLQPHINRMRLAGISANSNWLVDNVSLVPEPGTVVLLAFGLLSVLAVGRRKRSS